MQANRSRKEIYSEYLLTPHWAQLKEETFKAHGHSCHACGSIDRVDAHHLVYRENLSDCTTEDMLPLCRSCHEKLHKIKRVIHCTMQRKGRSERVAYVLSCLWYKYNIGSKPTERNLEKRQRKINKRELAWKNRVLSNPGRPLCVPSKKWVNYSETKIANEVIPIWEMPIRNRSAGPIVKNSKNRR